MFWETFRTSSPAYFRLIHRIMCSMQHRIIIPLLQDLVWSLIKAMRPWRGCYSASPRLPYPKLLFNGPWKTPTPHKRLKTLGALLTQIMTGLVLKCCCRYKPPEWRHTPLPWRVWLSVLTIDILLAALHTKDWYPEAPLTLNLTSLHATGVKKSGGVLCQVWVKDCLWSIICSLKQHFVL